MLFTLKEILLEAVLPLLITLAIVFVITAPVMYFTTGFCS